VPAIVFGGAFAFLGLAGVANGAGFGARLFALLLVGFGVWFAYRGARSASVSIDDAGVTTHSFLRTRRYRWAALAGAAVGVGRTGPTGPGRQFLVLHLRDGSEVAFRELNAQVDSVGKPTVVEEAAQAVNALTSA
jgi:hypothetical protein